MRPHLSAAHVRLQSRNVPPASGARARLFKLQERRAAVHHELELLTLLDQRLATLEKSLRTEIDAEQPAPPPPNIIS